MKRQKRKIVARKSRISRRMRVTITKPANSDLPPNENIQKFPDEVYGDTEIPNRKRPKV